MIDRPGVLARPRRALEMAALSLFVLALLIISGSAFAAEAIQSFDSDVRLARNGEMNVVETVRSPG